MADSPKHSRGSHFASSPNAASTTGAHASANNTGNSAGIPRAARSGARFKTAGSAQGGSRASARTSQSTVSPRAINSGATGMVSTVTPRSRSQRAADARGGHGHVGAIVGLVIGIVIVAAIAFVVVPRLFPAKVDDSIELQNVGSQVEVYIEDGSGATAIASQLSSEGIISSYQDFLEEMVKEGADSKLKSGAYVFTVGQDYPSIIAQLISGPNSTSGVFTIPEGSTLEAVASIVSGTLSNISAEGFIEQAKASNYKADYSFLADVDTSTYDTLEGFLYPKTYNFSGQTDVTADTVIRTMLNQFQTEIAALDFSYPESQGLSVAQVVSLASIVEKESTQSTGAMVAAVFWNRLDNLGEPNYGFLQSDATTAYSVKHDPTADEVHDANDPYSTYAYQGLPPTPICSPGLTSLQNVCSPDMDYIEGGYYYFYFWNDENGQIQYAFSKTLDEHNAAIANN